MSVVQTKRCQIQYRWCFPVIPWYRQAIALVFGVGVMLIALWAIQQGSGAWLIGSVVGMAFLTLLLIFGVEIDSIEVTDKVRIDFTNTGVSESITERRDEDE